MGLAKEKEQEVPEAEEDGPQRCHRTKSGRSRLLAEHPLYPKKRSTES